MRSTLRHAPALALPRPNAGVGRAVAAAGTVIAALTLSAIPPILMLHIVASTGANSLSNDYLLYVHLIDQILNGTYHWQNYFADTFVVNSHSIALPMLIRLAIIKLTAWNVYDEMFVGFAFMLCKLVLVFFVFTCGQRGARRYLLLPLLSALVFSTTQTDVFTYGDTSLELGLNQLGLALAAWALVCVPNRRLALTIMAVSEPLATFSGGGGLAVLPVTLLALVLLGYRRLSDYAVWTIATGVAALPYVFYRLIHSLPWSSLEAAAGYQHNTPVRLVDPIYLLGAIAYPFRDTVHPLITVLGGVLGLIFLVVCPVSLWRWRRALRIRQSVAPLLFVAYGLTNVGLTMVLRTGWEPWYTNHFMPIWIGLAGIAYVFSVNAVPHQAVRVWFGVVLATIAALVTITNWGFPAQLSLLYTRSPAAASCLRNYQTAPPYCEWNVFGWSVGHPGFLQALAQPLQRHHLSVFAPDEEWTLQGDFVLDTVHLDRIGEEYTFWGDGTGFSRLPWYDFRHLNLFLRAPNSITWTVHLPANVIAANFHSWVMAVTDAGRHQEALDATVTFQVGKSRPRLALTTGEAGEKWQPLNFSLTQYRGNDITLRLSARPIAHAPGGWVVYRYPVIDVQLDPRRPTGALPLAAPPEISPVAPHVQLRASRSWRVKGAAVEVRRGLFRVRPTAASPTLTNVPHLNVCLQNYSYLVLRAAVSPAIWPRAIVLYYRFHGQSSFAHDRLIPIPLQADSALHTYVYDLKLLDIPPRARLTSLRIAPVAVHAYRRGYYRIGDIRFIRTSSTSCST